MREWLTRRNRLGLALVAIGLVTLATQCHAERINHGAVVVTWVEDAATPVTCGLEMARLGYPLHGLLYLGTPECVIWGEGENWCEIRSPASDYLLGHALCHCFFGSYHFPLFPFAGCVLDTPSRGGVGSGE